MLPIVAISNLVTALVSGFITILIWQSYKKQPDPLKKDFLWFFVLLTIYFLIISMPAFFTYSGLVLAIATRVSNLFLYVAAAFFLIIPIKISGHQRLANTILPYSLVIGAALIILDFYYFKSSEFINIGKFFYFQTNQQMLVRILSGVIPLVGALVGTVFFIKYGLASHNQQLKTRVYLLGTGMSVLVLATILNYFIFSISFSFLSLMGASLAALTGLVIIGLGVLKKPLSM